MLSIVSVLGVFDLARFDQWLKLKQYQTEFNPINNPDCLDPKYLPKHIRQQLLDELSGIDLPEFVEQSLSHDHDQVDLKLVEQYNYLTQYFTRTNIDVNKIENSLLQQYWSWLSKFMKEKYASSISK
jgi:hypothetical protein